MKVVLVNAIDTIGGAARAAYRLHQGLREVGVDSRMLVQDKTIEDYTVMRIKRSKYFPLQMPGLRKKLDVIPVKHYKNKSYTLFSSACVPFSGVVDAINDLNPDIVHLHWVTNGMICLEELAYINKPLVWSLHDMWAFTGGCHYDEGCGKYVDQCCECPVLSSGKRADLSRRIFNRKAKTFVKITSLTIVGLSRWLTDCAQESTLFANRRVVNLPNPINTESYKPLPYELAREILRLPRDKKIVIFGAMHPTSDPRKGFFQLNQAIGLFRNPNFELAVFGSSDLLDLSEHRLTVHNLGPLHDDFSLRVLYSAANVMVVPSLQENLSNIIMESLACGTPVVAFDIGGNSDLIDHKHNGYLAKPCDPEDLARGIEWLLDHLTPQIFSDNARNKVLDNFEMTKVAQRYLALYENILQKS